MLSTLYICPMENNNNRSHFYSAVSHWQGWAHCTFAVFRILKIIMITAVISVSPTRLITNICPIQNNNSYNNDANSSHFCGAISLTRLSTPRFARSTIIMLLIMSPHWVDVCACDDLFFHLPGPRSSLAKTVPRAVSHGLCKWDHSNHHGRELPQVTFLSWQTFGRKSLL